MTPDQVRKTMAELQALCLRSEPMTPIERRQYRQQVADVRAADEARRKPTPQLELRAA